MSDTLYDEDFAAWTTRQAEALRRAAREGSNLPIDWEHLAEEIEDVGNEVRNKVESLLEQIQIHLLKIACSAFDEPRTHWEAEVDEFRAQLERQLRSNHAIRSRVAETSNELFVRSVKRVERAFKRSREPKAASDRLAAWKERGISAEEVQREGLYPRPGTLEFVSDPE